MDVTATDLLVRRGGFELRVASFAAGPKGTAVVGRNGAGKSTLLAALQGLMPSSGTLRRPARCAGVFAAPAFLRGSALGNVTAILHSVERNATARESSEERARKALATVGLGDHVARDVRTFSSGERQRLALARALVLSPEALFLDEAFANVDADGRTELRRLVGDYVTQTGCALVLATQSIADVSALCERVVVIDRGCALPARTLLAAAESSDPFLHALFDEDRYATGRRSW